MNVIVPGQTLTGEVSTHAESPPFLPVAEPDLGVLEEQLLLEAFRSGWVSSLGSFIGRFESQFAEFCNARFAVSTANGTTALHLCLVAMGIGEGDEVVLPSLTFVASAAAVRHANATPVFVDCDPEIGTMDPVALEAAVSPRTRAIIVVHLYGHPADMDPILEIAARHDLRVIEDAAEAHGAGYKDRKVGSIGDAACFSFYGNKVITTGEGGMIVTNNEELLDRCRLLRDHAMDPRRRYWHDAVGYNYRLTNLQAALGVAQLSRFEELSAKRQSIQNAYRRLTRELSLPLTINPSKAWADPTPWLVCAVLSSRFDRHARDRALSELRARNIDTRPFFIPLHLLPPYRLCRTVAANAKSELCNTESLAARGFNLPSSTTLDVMTVQRVVETLAEVLR